MHTLDIQLRDCAIQSACQAFRVDPEDILRRCRTQDVSEARFTVMTILREQCFMTSHRVAELLNKKCHGTVLHGQKQTHNLNECDKHFQSKFRASLSEFVKLRKQVEPR